jgi:diguanylate cyclase (GGDEF)-like protein
VVATLFQRFTEQVGKALPGFPIGALVVLAVTIYLVTRVSSSRALRQRIRDLEKNVAEHRTAAADLYERAMRAEKLAGKLQHSLVELPEIAQRLSASRDLRDVPERALDLVQELFDPAFSLFYTTRPKELVAMAKRGECEFEVGHRLRPGEGIVGWTATKQLPLTPDDVRYESAEVRHRNLSTGIPKAGFTICLPVTSGRWTIGVILIGPTELEVPRVRDVGRTIAMITAVTMTSAALLKRQRMLAKTDGLTGILNKTNVVGKLRETLLPGKKGPGAVSIFLFDIDHFKHYNDTNGHLAGDDLLRGFGAMLTDTVREREFVGRYGGEEFLLVMPGVEKAQAVQAAGRIRAAIEKHDFPFAEKQPGGRVTVSGGVASWPNDATGVEALVRAADEALYEAKRQGRNRVIGYAPPEIPTKRKEMPVPEEVEHLLAEEG